jgi:hypothetical protein
MARLYLFAEGQTEQTFATNLLKPYLAGYNVYLYTLLVAHAKKSGKVHRGGGRNYPAMKNDIKDLLAQEKGNDVFFTTMIDFYAIASNFPELEQSQKLHNVPDRQVLFLEEAFYKDIGDSRFIPYIQLHEYEAYLFSDPEKFNLFYSNHDKEIKKLKIIAASKTSPEQIDDGPQTSPSKQIIRVFPDYEGAKPTIGSQVAELIGLETIRSKCPHFNSWLSKLEQLHS